MANHIKKQRLPVRILINLLRRWLKVRFKIGEIGRNSFIMPPFARIINADGLFIGDNTRIGKYAFIIATKRYNDKTYNPEIRIGNNVSIGINCILSAQKNITIEDNVLIAQRVLITDSHHSHKDIDIPVVEQDLTDGKPVTIERDSYIGTNAVILPGVTIGKHAVVGANAVVTKDVPPYTVVAGIPAKPIKKYSEEKKAWVRI